VKGRVLALALAAVVLLAGCAANDSAAQKHPAAIAIARLLELRSNNNTDVAAYEPFFSDAEIAGALVDANAGATGEAAVPQWEPPYVSALTSDTAEVVVRWSGRTGSFKSWPEATVFIMKASEPRWVVSDAIDPEGEIPAALSAAEIGPDR